MKAYAIALALIVIIGFSMVGWIIYSAFPHDSRKVRFVLHTSAMSEADSGVLDPFNGPAVIAAHFAGKSDEANKSTPLADVFVCACRDKLDTSKTDTVLLLDTRLLHGSGDLDKPDYYWTGVKPAKKLNECRVLIPEGLVKKLGGYKYRYGRVELITDDYVSIYAGWNFKIM
jgi:hypothetical protein